MQLKRFQMKKKRIAKLKNVGGITKDASRIAKKLLKKMNEKERKSFLKQKKIRRREKEKRS